MYNVPWKCFHVQCTMEMFSCTMYYGNGRQEMYSLSITVEKAPLNIKVELLFTYKIIRTRREFSWAKWHSCHFAEHFPRRVRRASAKIIRTRREFCWAKWHSCHFAEHFPRRVRRASAKIIRTRREFCWAKWHSCHFAEHFPLRVRRAYESRQTIRNKFSKTFANILILK